MGPGNLIAYRGTIISQGLGQIACYPQLRTASREIAATLSRDPHNSDARLAKAEILRLRSEFSESAAILSQQYPDDRRGDVKRQLSEVLFEWAAHDPRQIDTIALRLKRDGSNADERWRLAAEKLRSSSRIDPSERVKILLAMFASSETQENDRSLSGLYAVSNLVDIDRRRWLQSRLSKAIAAAPATERSNLEGVIRAARDETLRDATNSGLNRFMDRFGWHPLSRSIRFKRAELSLQQDDAMSAERDLARLASSSDASTASFAVAKLATMYRDAGHTNAAVTQYRLLGSKFAKTQLPDGRSGAEIVAQLPASGAIRQQLANRDPWPQGMPTVSRTTADRAEKGEQSRRIEMQPALAYCGPVSSALAGRTLHYHYKDRTIVANDRFGQLLWRVAIDSKVELQVNYVPSVPLSYVQMRGHMVLVSLGDVVLAIDSLSVNEDREARLLWHKNTSDSLLSATNTLLLNRRWLRQRMGARWGGGALAYGRLATVDTAATDEAFYYCHHRSLHAVDLLTGKTLWRRRNIAGDSMILADREHVVVVSPGEPRALVLRASNGTAVGYRTVPPEDQRMATVGTRLLTWLKAGSRDEDAKVRVALYDPILEKQLWQHAYEPQSVASLVDDKWVSVMQPDGKWQLVRIEDGKVVLEEQLEAVAELSQLQVLRDSKRTYIVASKPWPADSPLMIQASGNGRKNPVVNGKVYAIDNTTGRILWRSHRASTTAALRNAIAACFASTSEPGKWRATSAAQVRPSTVFASPPILRPLASTFSRRPRR